MGNANNSGHLTSDNRGSGSIAELEYENVQAHEMYSESYDSHPTLTFLNGTMDIAHVRVVNQANVAELAGEFGAQTIMEGFSHGPNVPSGGDVDRPDRRNLVFVQHSSSQTGEAESDAARISKEVGKKALIYGSAFAGAAAVTGGVAFLALNVAVPAIGFTTAGISAGSYAAGMMSSAAIANGGGVASMASYGLVAILQSIGATGVATSTCMAGGAGAAAAGTGAVGIGEAVYRGLTKASPGEDQLGCMRYVKERKTYVEEETQTEDTSFVEGEA